MVRIPEISNECFFATQKHSHKILNISESTILKFNYVHWFIHTNYTTALIYKFRLQRVCVLHWHQTHTVRNMFDSHKSHKKKKSVINSSTKVLSLFLVGIMIKLITKVMPDQCRTIWWLVCGMFLIGNLYFSQPHNKHFKWFVYQRSAMNPFLQLISIHTYTIGHYNPSNERILHYVPSTFD